MKLIKHAIEAFLLSILILSLKLMPPMMASNLCGALGRKIGPKTGASRNSSKNIRRAYPKASDTDIEKINTDMWENLGRVIGEYPHLRCLTSVYCEVENIEILQDIAKNQTPCIFIGMHQANWEVAAMRLREQPGLNVGSVYRAPNNKWSAAILQSLRDYKKGEKYFAKSKQGVREMIGHLKNNGQVGILVDQKYNEGIEADFFGHPAMTSTAYIELAKKFKCPLIPVEMQRINKCYFKMTIHPALKLNLDDPAQAVADTHKMIEGWITKRPAEWLWVHKRWKASKQTEH
tara:strand:- start:209550 stop:210419 length:870 start_codon:yes stop_codon:yes gene_type:complete